MYLYFSIGNGQPREPALCQLYRHIFVACAARLCFVALLWSRCYKLLQY